MAKQAQTTWGDRMRLEGKRDTVLRVLPTRFAAVPDELRRQVETMETAEALDALLDRALAATALDDLAPSTPN